MQKDYLLILINKLRDRITDFSGFLSGSKDIYKICIALLVTQQAIALNNVITNAILAPILNVFSGVDEYKDITYNIFFVEIKLGELLIALIKLLISLITIYGLWKLFSNTNSLYINSVLESLEEKIKTL